MSKPVKELVRKELIKRFDGVTSLAVVGFTGVDANATVDIRKRLHAKGIRLTVVKNSLARQAFKTIGLETAGDLLDGPCAIATGGDSVVDVVRELLDIHKAEPNLTVKAAVLEGVPFGEDRVTELSKFPTRDEAIANIVGCALAPGAKLAGCLIGPASKIASILKTIEENSPDSEEPAEGAESDGPAEPEAAAETEAPAEQAPAEDATPEQPEAESAPEQVEPDAPADQETKE